MVLLGELKSCLTNHTDFVERVRIQRDAVGPRLAGQPPPEICVTWTHKQVSQLRLIIRSEEHNDSYRFPKSLVQYLGHVWSRFAG